MRLLKNIIPALLVCISLSSNLKANPYPVYFADVIIEDGKEILHFDWRPDYKSYDRAVITDHQGELVAELSYPLHSLDVTQLQGHSSLFITAVDTRGERSEAVEVDLHVDYSKLYASAPAEKIIVKKQAGEKAGFVGAESGQEFIVNGVNFCGIRTGTVDVFAPDFVASQMAVSFVEQAESRGDKRLFHQVQLGDLVQCYDPDRAEILMRKLKSNGYNVVRVFVRAGSASSVQAMSGPADTQGLYEPYIDNFIDFLSRAQKYGIYVIPCMDGMPNNDYFRAISKGAGGREYFFSKDGVKAKQHYIELFLQYIKKKDPELINTLFGLAMHNEFAFHSNQAPFNQLSGSYTFMDGTKYDMSDDDQRRALANATMQNYYTKIRETVEANAPGMLIGEGTFSMGAVGKTFDNSKGIRSTEDNGDMRFPFTAVELLRKDIDFLDFHIYRWGAKGTGEDVFMHFAENMKLTTAEAQELMKTKPVIMAEFGSFKAEEPTLDEAIVFVKELQKAALDFEFKGTAYWTIRCFEQTRLWNLVWENEKMLKAFSE